MSCRLHSDFPKRVKFYKKRDAIVHACRVPYPGAGYDMTACGLQAAYGPGYSEVALDARTPITCKTCLKALGDIDYLPKETNNRYVIQVGDTLFMKDSDGNLTSKLADAQLYKVEANAIDRTKIDVWYSKNGSEKMDSKTWLRQSWHKRGCLREEGWHCVREPNPILAVRKVKILFDDRKPVKRRKRHAHSRQ